MSKFTCFIEDGQCGSFSCVIYQYTGVLGLLTPKHGRLEDAATVKARMHAVADYMPLERLTVSPQCGFAPVEARNSLAQTTVGCSRGLRAPWEKPQSIPAITFSRPTSLA